MEKLRYQYSDLKKEYEANKQDNNELIKQLKRENFLLRTSISFRVGEIFVQAMVKPGKNTIFLPYYLARMHSGYMVIK